MKEEERILSEKDAVLTEDASVYEDSVQLNYIREDGRELFVGPPKAICPSVELLKKGTRIRIFYGANEKVIKVELESQTVEVPYEIIAKEKGKLRLYINDPSILKQLLASASLRVELEMRFPIPIEIEGEFALAKTEDGKYHWFFAHDKFMPVFVDLAPESLTPKFLKLLTMIESALKRHYHYERVQRREETTAHRMGN